MAHAEEYRARAIVAQIRSAQRETASAYWVERQIRTGDENSRKDLNNFFNSLNKTQAEALAYNFNSDLYGRTYAGSSAEYRESAVRRVAQTLASTAPKWAEKAGTVPSPAEDALLDINPARDHTATLSELRERNVKLSAATARYNAVRDAAIEAVSETLSQIMPQSDKTLLKAFMGEISSSVAKSALHAVTPQFKSEPQAAKDWVETALAAKPGEPVPVSRNWEIELKSLAPVQRGVTSEVAVALLAQRMHADAAAAHAARMRNVIYPGPGGIGGVRPSTATAPRFRFRGRF
jgi:hypothetical protein